MQTKTSIMLLMVFLLPCFLHRCESSSANNPTKQFHDDMQTRPILTYQCYQSGNSIDQPNSINYTILWDGTNPENTDGVGTTWSAQKGTPNSYTQGSLTTHYDDASGVIKLQTSTVQEDMTVLQPFDGKALYLKIVLTSPENKEVNKIYDVDYECRNAKVLKETVCPDPCNMQLTRELSGN